MREGGDGGREAGREGWREGRRDGQRLEGDVQRRVTVGRQLPDPLAGCQPATQEALGAEEGRHLQEGGLVCLTSVTRIGGRSAISFCREVAL